MKAMGNLFCEIDCLLVNRQFLKEKCHVRFFVRVESREETAVERFFTWSSPMRDGGVIRNFYYLLSPALVAFGDSGRRDLNPRPLDPQSKARLRGSSIFAACCVLPFRLFPRYSPIRVLLASLWLPLKLPVGA